MRSLLTALLVTPLLAGQELVSGPIAGSPLQPANVYAPSGPRAGQEFDVAQLLGKGPGAVLFVHEVSRETAPVIGGLDRMTLEYQALGFQSFTIRLAQDRTKDESLAKIQSNALKMHFPMVVSVDGAEGPGTYALNRKCTLLGNRLGRARCHAHPLGAWKQEQHLAFSALFTDPRPVPAAELLVQAIASALDVSLEGVKLPNEPLARELIRSPDRRPNHHRRIPCSSRSAAWTTGRGTGCRSVRSRAS